MTVGKFTKLCKYYHNLILEHFHHPKKKPHAIPQPQATTLCLYKFAFSGHFIKINMSEFTLYLNMW